MRHADSGRTVMVALTVLFAVILGAHLLTPSTTSTAAPPGALGPALVTQSSGIDSAGVEDPTHHLRHRTDRRVGSRMEPETPPPTDAMAVVARGVVDAWHDGYRTGSRYGCGVPPRDTSPAALQVFRC